MTKILKISALLTATILLAGMMAMSTSLEPVFAKNGAAKQNMDVWTGNALGQTIDISKSFSIARCDDAGTLEVNGHLHKTNQAGTQLDVYLNVDNTGFMLIDSIVPNKKGTGNFDGTITGLSSGTHSVAIFVNNPGNLSIYSNAAAVNDVGPFTGISFECP